MFRTDPASERGAILIQVAVASFALMAFAMFVVDYGVLWVSRHQAQNAADAGALAGAVAMAFDDFTDRSDTGPAKVSAHSFALANDVWNEDPAVDIATDIYFYADAPAKFPPECASDECIRVDVFRNQTRGNALPMWFGQLVGLSQQGTQATAVARAAAGDATDCLKPWAVVDKWDEHWIDGASAEGPWTTQSTFDKYIEQGPDSGEPDPAITTPDVYRPPTATYDDDGNILSYSAGSGFHPFDENQQYTPDYGRQLILKNGDNNDFQYGSGWFMRLALDNPTCAQPNGADCYRESIKHCVGVTYKVGDVLSILNAPGEATGPTNQAVATDGDPDDLDNPDNSLINQDPTAFWNPNLYGQGIGGVDGSAFAISPRIVAIPLVNPEMLAELNRGGRTTVPIANIAGFFIEGLTGNNPKGVIGRLITMPGLMSSGSGGNPASSFLKVIQLVR